MEVTFHPFLIMKPYKEKTINENIFERTFLENNSAAYIWHRDEENRKITVLESGKDWFFQIDNKLPEVLYPGKVILIEAHVFHRVIAGSERLKVEIVKESQNSKS